MIIKYIGSSGSVDFQNKKIVLISHDFFNYSWERNKNKQFNKKSRKYKCKIKLIELDDFGVELNKITSIFEKDITLNKAGKIQINDYYLDCFILESIKSNWDIKNNNVDIELVLFAADAVWISEKKTLFRTRADEGIVTTKRNFDYNYDFNFDYSSDDKKRELSNTSFKSVPFKMAIYGPCENPRVLIGGSIYQVNCELLANEVLEIDSKEKTIFKLNKSGQRTNVFHLRNRESYIFEPIPSGISEVLWSGDYGFDITLFEERSEPKWI